MDSSVSCSRPPRETATFHFQQQHYRLFKGGLASKLMLDYCQHAHDGQEHDPSYNEPMDMDVDLDLENIDSNLPSNNSHSTATKKTIFNDWIFYQALKQQPGCIGVELLQINIEHKRWFLTGVQAVYQCTFAGGHVVEAAAPWHKFSRFRLNHYHVEPTMANFRLKKDEFIVNLAFRTYSHITDRIVIQTNLRQFALGSVDVGGLPKPWLLPQHSVTEPQQTNQAFPWHKVVALAGITGDVEQLGCFSESQYWYRLRDWILIRALLEQGRACEKPQSTSNPDHSSKSATHNLLLHTNDDVFQRVLSFLIPETSR